jgi:hypothetical protein
MEGLESGWVVLAQVGAESVDHLGLVPDRVLMSASQHGDGLDGFAVDGQRPVGGYAGAEDIGQDAGVGGIRLGPGDAAAVAIARGSQRVDRVDLPSGCPRARDQQAARRLDRHRYGFLGTVAVAGQQLQQGVEASAVVTDPQLGQLGAVLIDQRDVVVVLGPVDTAEDLAQPRSPVCACVRVLVGSVRSTRRSNRSARGTPSHEPFVSPATGRDLGLLESSGLANV